MTQPGPVPLRPPAARATDPASLTPHLARLALLGLLVLTPIWGRDHAARLPWLYLVLLAFATHPVIVLQVSEGLFYSALCLISLALDLILVPHGIPPCVVFAAVAAELMP